MKNDPHNSHEMIAYHAEQGVRNCRASICLWSLSVPSVDCSSDVNAWFAAGCPAGRRYRSTVAGCQQQQRHSTAFITKCEQCHVYSCCSRLNADLLIMHPMRVEGERKGGTVGSGDDELATAAVRCSYTDCRSLLPVPEPDKPEERGDGAEAECNEGEVPEKTFGFDGRVTRQR